MVSKLALVLTCHPLSAQYNSYVQTMFFSMLIHCIAADGFYSIKSLGESTFY